jgi:nucleotide-binding universal stress UspA family protein
MTVHTIPRTPRGDTRSDDVAGTIAVPVDPRAGPTQAVAVAAALARQAGLEVEVMAVPPVGLSAGDEVAAATRAATQAGAPAAHGVELAGPGGVVPAIVERVRASGALLACMATHGRTRTGELRLGSVSAGVVQHSPVPVLLVGPGVRHASGRVRRLVACVDGSQRAAQALPMAARLAQRLDAELVLLRVFRIGDVVDTEQIDALRDLAARVPGPRPRLAVLVDDDPAAAIVRFAGDRGDTIVALGTRGRGVLCNAVLGSVARRVARQAACPVLAVPPAAAQPLRDQQRRLRSQAQAAREKDLSVVSASEPGSTGTAT